MDFFEHQRRARRNTWLLVLLFLVAVVSTIVATSAGVLIAGKIIDAAGQALATHRTAMSREVVTNIMPGQERVDQARRTESTDTSSRKDSDGILARYWRPVAWISLIVIIVTGIAVLYRYTRLSGGGALALQLGAMPVNPQTTDVLQKRLYNIAEEIAVATGIPVPQVCILEREQAINAFAAGYSSADATITVTQGALKRLDRDELQGMIAHEFSHILNGDMRLNFHLVALLYGVMFIGMTGRGLWRFSAPPHQNPFMPGLVLGPLLIIAGVVGLFYGRWIKAIISRQREQLADAAAVQFTRNPGGLAGALKKIGAVKARSYLKVDAEEIQHMLFADGCLWEIFATHPPLEKRIGALDPSFHVDEFEQIAARMQRHAQAREAAREESEAVAAARGANLPLDLGQLMERIGQPDANQVLAASVLIEAIPEPLVQAAHSSEWSPELLCYLLISADEVVREKRQLPMILHTLGLLSERQVKTFLGQCPRLADEQRLPLLEMALPSLLKRSPLELTELLSLTDKLIGADERVSVFEYALGRLAARLVRDALNPERARPGGHKTLAACHDQVIDLIAIVARHGHAEDTQAVAAARAALARLEKSPPATLPDLDNWPQRMDVALTRLDKLKPAAKQHLVSVLARCVMHDGTISVSEGELLRVICASLHVPLPVFDTKLNTVMDKTPA